MGRREKQILAALGGAALLATGFGAAGIGPLAGMMGAGAGAGAGLTGAGLAAGGQAGLGLNTAGLAGGAGLKSLLASGAGAVGKGAAQSVGQMGLQALMTPDQSIEQTVPGQIPRLSPMEDPFEWFHTMTKKGGRV